MQRTISAVLGVAVAGLMFFPSTALGESKPSKGADAGSAFTYQLKPVKHQPREDGGSDAGGRATIAVDGDRVIVKVSVDGLSPGLVHVQHIHGVGENRCPRGEARNDRVDDGLIDTVEGLPDYGAIQVSLTTSGDTSPGSGLAVERFPVADADGSVRYERTFAIGENAAAGEIPAAVAENLAHHHIVVHGIDVNDNGQYDFEAGTSGLSSALPLEAELPATCGVTKHKH